MIKDPVLLVCCSNKHSLFLLENVEYQVLDTKKYFVKWRQGLYPILLIFTKFIPIWVFWFQPAIVLIFQYLLITCFYFLLFQLSLHPMRDTIWWTFPGKNIFNRNVYKVAIFLCLCLSTYAFSYPSWVFLVINSVCNIDKENYLGYLLCSNTNC